MSEPEKALEFFAWNAAKVHHIISDIVMPCLNGLELAREAGKLKAGIAVILLSGFGETFPQAATVGNVIAVLEKPLARMSLERLPCQRAKRR